MAGPEKLVEQKIFRYLKSIGAFAWKVHGSGMQPAGLPDICCCINGWYVAIEVKRPNGGRVSELQKSKMKQINNAGGIAFVARSVDDVSSMLQSKNVI